MTERPIDLNGLPEAPLLDGKRCSHRELVDALHDLITTLRGLADLWTQQPPGDRAGPATGLRTQIRPQADHGRYGSGGRMVGYTPPWEADQ